MECKLPSPRTYDVKSSSASAHEKKTLQLSSCDFLAVLLCIFIVLFPKAGVKIGSVPLTWGYCLLGISAVIACPVAVSGGAILRISRLTLIAITALLPFQATLLYSILVNGIRDWGYALSDITNFILLPTVILVLFKPWCSKLNWSVVLRALRTFVFLAAAYGIILFCIGLLTGHTVEIPYLTVNADDYGSVGTEKDNSRNGILKLISTYNNGNLYGVATIILMPLFDLLEPRRWRRAILRIALVMTLSRTVWIALLLDQIFAFCAGLWSNLWNFPIIRPARLLKPVMYMLPLIGLLFVGLKVMARDFDFLFDPTFGDRLDQFQAFASFTIFPSLPVADIAEVVYASVLNSLGLVGFLSVLLLLGSPLLITLLDKRLLNNPIRAAALKGLLLYAVIAWADGAITLIPVMTFYWFTMFLLINGDGISWQSASEVTQSFQPIARPSPLWVSNPRSQQLGR